MALLYTAEVWNKRYGQAEYAYGTAPNDFLVSMVDRIPKGQVLCLCEGEGRNGVYLAEQGCTVTGVDGSANGLQKAQALAEERGVTITTVVADLADYAIAPNTYDAVVSIFAHLPHELRRRIHTQVVAGLRPGGVLVLEAYTPAQIGRGTGGPSTPDLLPTLADLRTELAGLDIVLGQEIEREIHEGAFHGGMSSVVQLLAVKPIAQAI
jgi:2-polyprenyl-3-methyl-5-hydroxy-6-metoxy-1,4-benzoquinol methylase